MDTVTLAQYMGIFSLILGVSMFIRRKMVMKILDDFFTNRTLAYVVGLIETAAGLILVFNHNVWGESGLATVVTIIGWLLLIEGLIYVFSRVRTVRGFADWIHNKQVYKLVSVAMIVLGGYLVWASGLLGQF